MTTRPPQRFYGPSPFRIAVIHGGPGAAGEMAPVARRLADSGRGVLEPLQTATTLEGQVAELADTLETYACVPAVLIGHSWGAWLSGLVAARHPALVDELILVGSGPFLARDAATIGPTRTSRLDEAEQAAFRDCLATLDDPRSSGRNEALARLGALAAKTDAYDPVAGANKDTDQEYAGDVFQRVWNEAAQMRASGELLARVGRIRCPVRAIHGDYDPHPASGVHDPLSRALADFRMVLLRRCGHTPWVERHAAEEFYRQLEELLREPPGSGPP